MIKKKYIIILLAIFLVLSAFAAYYIYYLNMAHSTFENYYAFRGCTTLVEKTDTYGICNTDSGQTIKIVKFQNAWYLDGDLPCSFLCF